MPLDSATVPWGCSRVMWKMAFMAGSSKQGKAFLASVGCIWVVATILSKKKRLIHKKTLIFILCYQPCKMWSLNNVCKLLINVFVGPLTLPHPPKTLDTFLWMPLDQILLRLTHEGTTVRNDWFLHSWKLTPSSADIFFIMLYQQGFSCFSVQVFVFAKLKKTFVFPMSLPNSTPPPKKLKENMFKVLKKKSMKLSCKGILVLSGLI